MIKETTYDPFDPFDMNAHVSFTDRVAQIREKHGGFTHLSSEAIEALAEPLKPLIGKWKAVFHSHDPVVSITAYHGQSFDMSDSDFNVIDNKAVLTNCGRYSSDNELDGITRHLNTYLAGNFNELVLASNKTAADRIATENDAVLRLLHEAKQVAELSMTSFLIRHGVANQAALRDKVKVNPDYLARIVVEVVWENLRGYHRLAVRNGIKSGVYPYPAKAPEVVDPSIKRLAAELEVMRAIFTKKAAVDISQKAEHRVTTNFEV